MTTSAETGGATILSYNAQWDQGTGGAYENLVGYLSDFSTTTFTLTSGISPGTTFKFRVRAKNMWGWSADYSDVLIAIPSDIPSQMETVITALDSTTGSVIISWVAPNDNAATISEFSIEILN